MDVFDGIRAGVIGDRSQFFKDLSAPFYGANRPGAKVSQGLRDSFWLQGMQAGHKAVIDCIKAFSETDLTEDLKKFDVPTLILHGDDDQIVPRAAARHVLDPQRPDQRRPAVLRQRLVQSRTVKDCGCLRQLGASPARWRPRVRACVHRVPQLILIEPLRC